jgi:biopolymer transport protein ExbD
MSDVNDSSSGSKDVKKPSGAARRIVVENLPPEEAPRVQGRRLETPADLDRPSRRLAAPQSTPAAQPLPLPGGAKEPINVKRLVLIIGVMVALPVVAGSVLLVLSAARKNKSQRQAQTPVVVTHESGQITTTDVINPSPQPSVEEAPATATTVNVESADILLMTEKLATQISGKSGYEFAPELIELIRTRAQEYNNAKALLGARQFRREINKSFRDEGLTPLVGYALAMSRSKFDPTLAEKGLGIWQISLPVARSQGYVGAADNGAKLRAPESSAQISASYTRQLLSAFDADDFMYAIACFGMNLEEAGSLQARLVNAAPNSKDRRDIMKMIRAGVLNKEQVDNIARFLAAGIVGENPQRFGLTESQPFSSLY